MTIATCLSILCLLFPSVLFGQPAKHQVPPFLVDETYRLSRQCYFFQEYATIKQKNRWYVLGVFLSREAVPSGGGTRSEVSPQSPCGSKPAQLRLYRLVSDTTVAFCDSVVINSYSVSIRGATDFDGSGLHKIQIQQACNPPKGAQQPLLCYAISLFEITQKARFRSLLRLGDVPEQWVDDQPTGRPLEPVMSEHLDKSVYPELLAIDDFFEGDPAFRADDFPKVTLIYAWGDKGKVFKNASDKFSYRFQPITQISRLPDNMNLVTVVEMVMTLAAVKRFDDANKLMDLNLTPDRFSQWRAEAPERGAAIVMERIKEKLGRCIARYK
ncbi:MAG: hypothetical protein HW412_1276 [Bacteroidetes bacterium]|nr:hypothetical protein [Bacteroidota bacterium]